MEKGKIKVFFGEGHGKSDAALGHAIHAAAQGKEVTVIQFLKCKNESLMQIMNRLEPEIKYFRFEKRDYNYETLSAEERQEEGMNIKNGVNYAKKVLQTGECNMLILDEVLGLLDCGIIRWEELKPALLDRAEETEVILTGRVLNDEVRQVADEVCHIVAEK